MKSAAKRAKRKATRLLQKERVAAKHRLAASKQEFDRRNREAESAARAIVQAASKIRWDRRESPSSMAGQVYRMQLDFDPYMLGHGMLEGRELDYLADAFADEVRHEIRSSKFLQDAHDNRRAGIAPDRPFPGYYPR